MADDEHHHHHHHHQRNFQIASEVGTGQGVEVLGGGGVFRDGIGIDLVAGPGPTGDTAHHEVKGHGPDNGVGPQLADDKPVDCAHQQAGRNAAQEADNKAHLQQLHCHHAGKGNGHRQAHVVKVRGVDDEGKTYSTDAGERYSLEDGVHIVHREKLFRLYDPACQ